MWSNYPEAHSKMSFQHKFFFIIQIAYWLHQFPELYFQKVKKDEMWQRIQLSLMYLLPITTAYLLKYVNELHTTSVDNFLHNSPCLPIL
jgi:translocating chain-associated membrane protein 1